MAIVVQSVSTHSWENITSFVVPKPTGLAIGDLMLGIAAVGNLNAITDGSGWTLIRLDQETLNQGCMMYSAWKIADSGDVAATNITFGTFTSQNNSSAILRITGHNAASPIGTNTGGPSESTASPSRTGLTPADASSLLVMAFNAAGGAPLAIGSYAIVTSNPSWTEDLDITGEPGLHACFSVAHAIRPEVTATGNYSATGTGATGSTSWASSFLVVKPAAPSNIKTYNGNLQANIKTINTNAIANVKTLDLNTNT